jgi:ketosteroid isomerase-like protein
VSQGNVDVVGRSFEAFNTRDVNELVSLSTPDCEWLPFRAQLEGIVYRGHEGVRRFVSDIEDDWEVYQVDPLEFHDRGELVAVVGQVRAVGRGSSVDIDSIAGFVFELQRGRIRHVTSHSNPEAAREAVGVESG